MILKPTALQILFHNLIITKWQTFAYFDKTCLISYPRPSPAPYFLMEYFGQLLNFDQYFPKYALQLKNWHLLLHVFSNSIVELNFCFLQNYSWINEWLQVSWVPNWTNKAKFSQIVYLFFCWLWAFHIDQRIHLQAVRCLQPSFLTKVCEQFSLYTKAVWFPIQKKLLLVID